LSGCSTQARTFDSARSTASVQFRNRSDNALMAGSTLRKIASSFEAAPGAGT
jgi:hypothetical protein